MFSVVGARLPDMEWKLLSDARPGDYVAEDVCAPDGRIVLKAGAQLSDFLLLRLARFGVREVAIAAPTDSVGVRARLDRMFAPWQGDDVMERLRRLLLAHRLGGIE